eukprot:746928-Hanusia_phi.AAC.1
MYLVGGERGVLPLGGMAGWGGPGSSTGLQRKGFFFVIGNWGVGVQRRWIHGGWDDKQFCNCSR